MDLVGLGLLIGLGLFGFRTAYGGSRFLMAGLIGMALGLVIALWGARTRQPLIVVVAATVGAFFLFGGAVAVPDKAIAGFLPSPGTILALVDGAVSGWVKLLTSNPPVGSRDNLLVVPFVCGLLAAVISLTIARRTRFGGFALVPAVIVLALSILFGTDQPANAVLQGAVFAVVAIGWASLHRRASRRVDVGTGRSRRTLGVVGVLALAALVPVLLDQVGVHLPGTGSNPRVVLRDDTEPPFDPRNHPSPLASFRRYATGGANASTELFKVTGLGPQQRVRLAVLDSYDGVVYSVGSGPGSSGYFERVGESVSSPVKGDAQPVSITVEGYRDVWVPGAGYLDDVTFKGPRAEQLREGFRYNASTGSAAESTRLRKGDTFVTQAVLPPTAIGDGKAAKVEQPDAVVPEDVPARASEFAAAAFPAGTSAAESTQYQQVNKGIIGQLNVRGAPREGNDGFNTRPGHQEKRLEDMVADGGVMIGDDEQYAPLAALMARSLGVPARVVMGFVVPDHENADQQVSIAGKDVAAWVEVNLDGVGWVPTEQIKPTAVPTPRPQPEDAQQSSEPPPPPPTVPPTEDDDVDANKVICKPGKGAGAKFAKAPGAGSGETAGGKDGCGGESDDGWSVPRWVYYATAATLLPIAVLAGFTGLIAGLKSRRRSRRRSTGVPSHRVAGGWHEVIDLAADMGSPIPVLATRNEGALLMGTNAAVGLARHADVGIFGATDLSDDWVASYWNDVDSTRTAMTADMSRMERWRVLVSLASLRASFDRWRHGDRRSRANDSDSGGAEDESSTGGSLDGGSGVEPTDASTWMTPPADEEAARARSAAPTGGPGSGGEVPTLDVGAAYADERTTVRPSDAYESIKSDRGTERTAKDSDTDNPEWWRGGGE